MNITPEMFSAMQKEDEKLLVEANEAGDRAAQWLAQPENQQDMEHFVKEKMAQLGISEAFLSGESTIDTSTPMFFQHGIAQERDQLAAARERLRARMDTSLHKVCNNILNTMRSMYQIRAARKGVVVFVMWPEPEHFAFRSLRTAKVWNKKRIRAIKEQK